MEVGGGGTKVGEEREWTEDLKRSLLMRRERGATAQPTAVNEVTSCDFHDC